MSTDWSDEILISNLADEPDLSDELSEIHARLEGLEATQTPDVVLNLSAVTHLNSSNIAQLLRLRTVLQQRERRLALCSVANPVWSTMLLTGLDKVFDFAPDPATALASLQIDRE